MAKSKPYPKKSPKSPKVTKPAAKVPKLEPVAEVPSQHQVVEPVAAKKSMLSRLRPQKRPKPAHMPGRLPSSFAISKKAFRTLWSNKKIFLTLAALYALLNFILVRGLSTATNLSDVKEIISSALPGAAGSISSSFAVFGVLLGSGGASTSDAGGLMQLFLTILTSLAIVWLLRQVMAGERVRVRDGFYKGMYPLVPVILVMLVILLQLLPFILGGSIYNIVIGNSIAIGGVEIAFWSLLFFLSALLSLYLLTSSIMALYIATLPDMTPLKALASARDLVRYRRWSVLRKLLFLPIGLFVLTAMIMLPIIMLATPVAVYVFFALSMLGILVVHAYLYSLYRELLT